MNEQNRERKPSYLKAVVGDKTDKQAELLSFEKSLSSSDAGADNPILNSVKPVDTPTETFFVAADAGQGYKETLAKPERQTWKDFSDYTTLHGFRFIFVRRSLWVRLVWLVLLLTCTGYVVYSLCNSIIKYFDFPIATIMKIEHPEESMPFPAVTLCPMTTLTKTKASMRDDNPRFNITGLNIDACQVTAAVRAGRPCGEALICCCTNNDYVDAEEAIENCTSEYKNELLEVINARKGSFNERDFFKAYGPSIAEMIVKKTCVFGSSGERCSNQSFDPVVTEFGLCYSFNSKPGEKTLNVSYGDVSAGLFVMLDLHVNDHFFGFYSEGVRVLVHNQGEYINPWNGVLVAPGSHAQISITRKVYRNKKKPYETKCDDSIRLASFETYTSDGCSYECLSNKTFAACKCRAIGDTGNSADRVCFREDDNCTYGVVNDLFEGTKQCNCPLACDAVSYEPTVSTASFPNPSMMKILQNKGYIRTEDYFRKNLIFLQVGYKALSYEYFRQKAQYDSGALMGEIGGNLGLFLGCSILTICEFVDFVIYLCYIRNKKRS